MTFGLPQKHMDAIKEVFARHPAINAVLVFGSRAKGNYKPSSDIDLVLIDDTLSFSEFLRVGAELDDLLLPYEIDLSQKKRIETTSLLEHIDRVGVVFYKKGQS